MTSIMDMVQEHLGDGGINQLTQHLGVDPATAQAAAAAALPMLVNAMSNQPQPAGAGVSGMGAGGLGGAAGGLLANVFGNNHPQVSQQVAQHSGLDIHQAEKALLFLTPIVMAQLAKRRQEAGVGATPSAGTPAAPGVAPAPPAESGLGRVIGAVEKMLHRNP